MDDFLVYAGCIAGLIIAAILSADDREPPTRTHRGLEMKAKGGKLIYVRETESEREI